MANRILLVVGLLVVAALIALAASQTSASNDEELSPAPFTLPTDAGDETTTTTEPPTDDTTDTTDTTGVTTTTTPPDTLPEAELVTDHVPEDIVSTCETNTESIVGVVLDAVDCVPSGDDPPTFVTYYLFTDQASTDEFYDSVLAENQVPAGECSDIPFDCTYTGETAEGRYSDFFLDVVGCRIWTDDVYPIAALACMPDDDFDALDTWWFGAGPV